MLEYARKGVEILRGHARPEIQTNLLLQLALAHLILVVGEAATSQEPGRRPAGYIVATAGSKSFDDPGVFRELPLVNRIRPRVKAWRERRWKR